MTAEADDSALPTNHMHQLFEVARVPATTWLFECVAASGAGGGGDDDDEARRTFAAHPLCAIDAFRREHPTYVGDVTLRVCVADAAFCIFDLDPLQYTRTYGAMQLSEVAGASNKQQRARRLDAICEYLSAQQPANGDSFRLLQSRYGVEFAWTPDYALDEVLEEHPVVAGIHYIQPGASIFAPRLIRLVKRRVRIGQRATLTISAEQLGDIKGASPSQLPSPIWSLVPPDARTLTIHNFNLPVPTEHTSLTEVGWRQIEDLRNRLLEHARSKLPAVAQSEICNKVLLAMKVSAPTSTQ